MSTTTAVPQHMEALASANRIRGARGELKKQVRRGAVTVSQVLDPEREIPTDTGSMPIAELLRAQERWGNFKARKVCIQANVGEQKPIGTLTRRQRRHLLDVLAGRPLLSAI